MQYLCYGMHDKGKVAGLHAQPSITVRSINAKQICIPLFLLLWAPTHDMPCSSTTSPVFAFTNVSSTNFIGAAFPAVAQVHTSA